ncbi:hypothetical protein [Ottowia testudinis]|uniref:Uncharacterized protein n=1 Tax=Ottowia testudinis TaxID=2816950 RepID=A0A975CNS1_9BURK|nr:hypothetical protein [Ottowia testudinis]QTD46903.1 hypothetical protein J1M35_08545 [Ottowia testudinis]
MRGFALFATSLLAVALPGPWGRKTQVVLAVAGIGLVWGATLLGLVLSFQDDSPLRAARDFAERHGLWQVAKYVGPVQLLGGAIASVMAWGDEPFMAFWLGALLGSVPGFILYLVMAARHGK